MGHALAIRAYIRSEDLLEEVAFKRKPKGSRRIRNAKSGRGYAEKQLM